MHFRTTIALAAALATGAALAQDAMLSATVALKGADGADHGSVTLTETPAGVLVRAELAGVPPGAHGFHFHESGACEPPFESAGGHYNPTAAEHGFKVVGGPHGGDMPNIHVPDSGALTVEMLNTGVTLEADAPETLFDDDGTALIIHAGADDYESQPSGDAGDRIACGIVEK
jgi:Cu-Zn family superoxide dismutase